MVHDFDSALEVVLLDDPRYSRAAYHFLREVLETLQCGKRRKSCRSVQIPARELLERVRVEAIQQFGPMAFAVLEDWGIRSCDDLGEMVFLMIRHGIVQRGRGDRREDFQEGFDFTEAFRRPFVRAERTARPPAPAPGSGPEWWADEEPEWVQ